MVRRQSSQHRAQVLVNHAGEMRFAPTRSEERLWRALSGGKLGVGFKRQVTLGGRFVVDFLASQAKLVVEVDGAYHRRRVAADARRDRALRALGYRVLRLDADLVLHDLPAVLRCIWRAIEVEGSGSAT